MNRGASCAECRPLPARGWWVDVETGETFCGRHGRDRPMTIAMRSPRAVASAIRRSR